MMPSWKSISALLSLGLCGVALTRAEDKPLLPLPVAGDPMLAESGNDGPSPLLFDTPTPDPTPVTTKSAPSQNATINLIRLLVKKGVLTEAEAAEMIQQAEDEAVVARAQAAAPGPDTEDSVRVTYVPEVVRNQIRDELKADVLSQARAEGWAAPREVPDWTKHVTLFGDVRLRYHANYYPKGNDNTGAFPNFNVINTGAPFDTSGTIFSPQNDVDQDRNRLRLRVRLGADANLENGWFAGIRIGTGESSEAASLNQTLGAANNGQGGNFNKYALWLDRGFIRYDLGGAPHYTEHTELDVDGKTLHTAFVSQECPGQLSLFFGRFDNPFFTTSEVIWDEDVGFDGLAIRGRYRFADVAAPFFSAGLFPIFNTDYNFSTNQPAKFQSTDKWLYAAQGGVDLRFSRNIDTTLAVAYYNFDGVQGKLSDPYIPLTNQDQSNTDTTRQSFAQRGNTYRPIRNIVPDALNNFGTSNQFQYFGLASPFEVLAYTGRINLNYFEPLQISLLGEYAKNLAFDKEAINKVAVNNRGPLPVAPAAANGGNAPAAGAPPPVGGFVGGDTAWNVALVFGKPVFERAGDWNISFGYRYVESDAVIDAFTDSDFAAGGTNAKGYTVGGSVALSPRVKFGVRWMSADQVSGPPLKSDVLLLDLTAKF
ncbi:MAG TPA: putative porin [Verrucomicrobiaceae bacterium]